MPCSAVVLGELWIPGRHASAVKTAIKEQSKLLRFTAFAIGSEDASLGLGETEMLCNSWGLHFADYEAMSDADECKSLTLAPLPEGAEGWVFKDANRLNWEKWKPTLTIELIVDGFTSGTGKYLGLIGAVHCKTIAGNRVARVSGMKDAVRVDMTNNEDEYIGRVCEVAYQYVGSRGRLRHPRFVCWRDDKRQEDCAASQDPKLAEAWAEVQPCV